MKSFQRNGVEKINEKNADAALVSNGLNSFLKIQHALEKIMYFDSGFLRELVIVDHGNCTEIFCNGCQILA